jgi:hypothetical protein
MQLKFKIVFAFVLLFFCFNLIDIRAQILRDSISVQLVKKDIDFIYNFQFDDARKNCNIISELYPGHPVVFLLKGMIAYWENYPLLPTSPTRASFEENLKKCIKLCEAGNTAYEVEFLLTNLCARGMLLLFYSGNDLSREVFPLVPTTYRYIRRSFDLTSVYADFYYFTGVYNYYREAYPEAYPVYKPLVIVFPRGGKEKGITELSIAARNSIVLRAESQALLSLVYFNFEKNYQKATFSARALYMKYPENLQYLITYIKNLIMVNQYSEAENLISFYSSTNVNSFFSAQFAILSGIIKEKKYHDYRQAEEFYSKGVKNIIPFGHNGHEFLSYAYFGLSRINEANGDKDKSKIFREKAIKLADFKEINFD